MIPNARPRRHVVVALTFLACVIAYTDRVNISVAAVAMREHFGWSQTQKGWVLSGFFGAVMCAPAAGGPGSVPPWRNAAAGCRVHSSPWMRRNRGRLSKP